jgi:hypothetical protein
MSGGDWFLVLAIGAFSLLLGVIALASGEESRARRARGG